MDDLLVLTDPFYVSNYLIYSHLSLLSLDSVIQKASGGIGLRLPKITCQNATELTEDELYHQGRLS